MCGRFVLYTPEKIVQRFSIDVRINVRDLSSSYNIAPGQNLFIITERETRTLTSAVWGFQPPWGKPEKPSVILINIRSESLLQKRGMQPLLVHRCLIPANGFYEWAKEGSIKQPYYFYQEPEEMFAFAGLYQIIKDRENNPVSRCAIITTKAKKPVSAYHSRMPLILFPGEESRWIFPSLSRKEQHFILQRGAHNIPEVCKVSPKINSPENNSPDLISPLG